MALVASHCGKNVSANMEQTPPLKHLCVLDSVTVNTPLKTDMFPLTEPPHTIIHFTKRVVYCCFPLFTKDKLVRQIYSNENTPVFWEGWKIAVRRSSPFKRQIAEAAAAAADTSSSLWCSQQRVERCEGFVLCSESSACSQVSIPDLPLFVLNMSVRRTCSNGALTDQGLSSSSSSGLLEAGIKKKIFFPIGVINSWGQRRRMKSDERAAPETSCDTALPFLTQWNILTKSSIKSCEPSAVPQEFRSQTDIQGFPAHGYPAGLLFFFLSGLAFTVPSYTELFLKRGPTGEAGL